MLNCYTKADTRDAVSMILIPTANFADWLKTQASDLQNWVRATAFTARPESFCLVPNAAGHLTQVLVGITSNTDLFALGALPLHLPPAEYQIVSELSDASLQQAAIAWGLGAYQFTRYKKTSKTPAKLVIPSSCDADVIQSLVEAHYLIRDLINTPPENMGPSELAEVALDLAKKFKANSRIISGEELLDQNYPAIHAVGRASSRAPRLIDLRWGNPKHPKLTLVGKGVCFDTGGLDIKPAAGMILMKKDMAGAAHVLGLARLIMGASLPVNLRVLIPAVENSVSGNAYRPSDVINTRKGITVEIGNTDAEGRVILADALAEAASENPDLIIDFATLTGSARVALGPDLPAFFTDNNEIASQLLISGEQQHDRLWRLPLHTPYRKMLDSSIADINNSSTNGFAGAILAGLFLKEFVHDTSKWIHLDIFGWNNSTRAARPEGGEANALRAVFSYLQQRFT